MHLTGQTPSQWQGHRTCSWHPTPHGNASIQRDPSNHQACWQRSRILPSSSQGQHPSKPRLSHKHTILCCCHQYQVACRHRHSYQPCSTDPRQCCRKVCRQPASLLDALHSEQDTVLHRATANDSKGGAQLGP